ncbi:MAG: polyprenyl synthetase family protein [Thermoplasmatota archaeon]
MATVAAATNPKILERLAPYRDAVEGAMLASLDDISPQRLREACLHYPRAGGKRLRPIMSLLAAEAAGGRRDDAIPLGVALECIHNFSLIHDDIMDRDDLRRGIPTVHKAWDEPTAILAGDTLFAKAFEVLGEAQAKPERVRRVVRDVATMARVLCEGQQLDMEFPNGAPSEEQYMDMIERKTARLFESAARGGAEIAGGAPEAVQALAEYGRAFGVAFQIRDDLLDFLATTEQIGKPAASDIRRGKRTVVVLRAFKTASPAERQILQSVLGKADASEHEVSQVYAIFHSTGAVAYASKLVHELTDEALYALMRLPKTAARATLEDLARWQADRAS